MSSYSLETPYQATSSAPTYNTHHPFHDEPLSTICRYHNPLITSSESCFRGKYCQFDHLTEEEFKAMIDNDKHNHVFRGCLRGLAFRMQRVDNFEPSNYIFQILMESEPDNVVCNFGLAQTYAGMHNIQKAKQYYFRAITIAPNDDRCHSLYADFLHRTLNEKESAKRYYRTALKLNANNPYSHCNYAKLLDDEGNIDEAERHYTKCLELTPNKPPLRCLFELGMLYHYKRHKLHKAKRCFDQLMDLSMSRDNKSRIWDYFFQYALLLKRMHYKDEALAHFRIALKACFDIKHKAEISYEIGLILDAEADDGGDRQQAQVHFNNAQIYDPQMYGKFYREFMETHFPENKHTPPPNNPNMLHIEEQSYQDPPRSNARQPRSFSHALSDTSFDNRSKSPMSVRVDPPQENVYNDQKSKPQRQSTSTWATTTSPFTGTPSVAASTTFSPFVTDSHRRPNTTRSATETTLPTTPSTSRSSRSDRDCTTDWTAQCAAKPVANTFTPQTLSTPDYNLLQKMGNFTLTPASGTCASLGSNTPSNNNSKNVHSTTSVYDEEEEQKSSRLGRHSKMMNTNTNTNTATKSGRRLEFEQYLRSLKLSAYLLRFEEHQCDDIGFLEYLDEKTLSSEIGMSVVHRNYFLKQIERFREDRQEFETWLTAIKLKDYIHRFHELGIMTFDAFYRRFRQKQDLVHAIGNECETDASILWSQTPRQLRKIQWIRQQHEHHASPTTTLPPQTHTMFHSSCSTHQVEGVSSPRVRSPLSK